MPVLRHTLNHLPWRVLPSRCRQGKRAITVEIRLLQCRGRWMPSSHFACPCLEKPVQWAKIRPLRSLTASYPSIGIVDAIATSIRDWVQWHYSALERCPCLNQFLPLVSVQTAFVAGGASWSHSEQKDFHSFGAGTKCLSAQGVGMYSLHNFA